MADDPLTPSPDRPVRAEARSIRTALLYVQMAGDAVCVISGLLAAFALRFHSVLPLTGETVPPSIDDYGSLLTVGFLLFAVLLFRADLYHPDQILQIRRAVRSFLRTGILWLCIFLAASLIFKLTPPISRLFVLFAALLCCLFLVSWRWVLQQILTGSRWAGVLSQRIIVVGWDNSAGKLQRAIVADPCHPYQILGCVPSSGGGFRQEPPVPVLGDYADLPRLLAGGRVDMVVLTDLDPMMGEIVGLANLCEKELVQFRIIPSYFQILLSGLSLGTISGVPLLGVNRLPLDHPTNQALKRIIDILGSVVGLVLFAPVIVVLACLVYRESPGPVFYRQRRLGRDGHPFEILKIRSMRLDAETESGAAWTTQDDRRRLRIGAFLRSSNLDELPQLWNVLKGEMSLVGPRPERPEFIADFKEEIPHYNARHSVKPGMTGWAQIHGFRGDTDLNERIRCDLYYLENWTLLLDVYIMVVTPFRIKNAY